MTIDFPTKTNQRYYDIHYNYLLQLFKDARININLKKIDEYSDVVLKCFINNKEVLFDFSDDGCGYDKPGNRRIIFKFHYKEEYEKRQNIFSFCPVSFNNWEQFKSLSINLNYECEGKILYNQRYYGNAKERRKRVFDLLTSGIYNNLDLNFTSQLDYFKKINDCLVSIHVPGQNNNILDRAQLQLMAFGVCTISPNLPEIFPNNKKLIPGIHYIKCKNDYVNLYELIHRCKNNRQKYIEIGNNAKQFFYNNCTPHKLVRWVKVCLN